MNSSVFIIVPAFNEATVICKTVRSLLSYGYTVVVVDDGSTDETAAVIQNLPLYYIRHHFNLGQGAALQTGIYYALKKGADYLITFDADGQHTGEDVILMLKALREQEADIVFGSRFLSKTSTNISFRRKLVIHFARLINFIFTGVMLSDAHNGLRILNRHAASKITLVENGMAHATEILIQAKKNHLRIAECPVHIIYTRYSKEKGQKLSHSFKVLQDLLLYKLFK